MITCFPKKQALCYDPEWNFQSIVKHALRTLSHHLVVRWGSFLAVGGVVVTVRFGVIEVRKRFRLIELKYHGAIYEGLVLLSGISNTFSFFVGLICSRDLLWYAKQRRSVWSGPINEPTVCGVSAENTRCRAGFSASHLSIILSPQCFLDV